MSFTDVDQPLSIAERRKQAQTGSLGSTEEGYGGGGAKGSQLYAYPFDIDLEQDHLNNNGVVIISGNGCPRRKRNENLFFEVSELLHDIL